MERTTESEACALLHILEQLRQHLTDCVAVYAEPRSVEHDHNESMASSSDSAERRGA